LVREYLAAFDATHVEEDGGGGAGGLGKGGGQHKRPKEISLTDPQATWVARPSLDANKIEAPSDETFG
jgi:hypothetical protein